ncbi:mitochondrial dna helicase [Colletotrichum plurivorum]|uniref:ATP-dependent DNA helicase n=1 Tax=Colletotrichum plurivorum TaxID=2175906 RepID=A0A8H6KNG2_9PEZI|nr:mitochondrial dna helicase [Colletotrichum plurivorum]
MASAAASMPPQAILVVVGALSRGKHHHQPVVEIQRTGPPVFLRRNQDSQDTPEQAAARAEQARIQRQNRADRRSSLAPPLTPTSSDLMHLQAQGHLRSPSVPGSPMDLSPPFNNNRCLWCAAGTLGRDLEAEQKWCVMGDHNTGRILFDDEEADMEYVACFQHRPLPFSNSSPPSTGSDNTYDGMLRSSSPVRSVQPRPQPAARTPGQPRARPQPRAAAGDDPNRGFHVTDPVFDGDLNAEALTLQDQELISNLYRKLDQDELQTCLRYSQRWFDLNINDDGVCKICRNADGDNPVFLFGAANNMDFGDVPAHLPQLTYIEEILISRIHCAVDLCQVRGVQYAYKGLTINFLRNVAKVHDQLPLLPQDVDVVLICPRNADNNPGLRRQFRSRFTVRKSVIRTWLQHLLAHHPGYADVVVSDRNIDSLPENGDVTDSLPQEVIDELAEDLNPDMDLEDDVDDEGAAVPNVMPEEADLDRLRQEIGAPHRQEHIDMPSFRATPLNDMNDKQALLSLAFPSLFPNGQAEFVQPRQRTVDYLTYVQHAIKWKDGRFARHPRFRFVAFNTMMRRKAAGRSVYFAKHTGRQELTVEDLRSAFAEDTPESKALLNSVVRFADVLKGTRTYWQTKRNHLEACVYTLGCPAVFLTFSAADYHWFHLMKHMPRFEQWKNSTPIQQIQIAWENLRDNPHIAAHLFVRRSQLFRQEVLAKKYCIVDYWDRCEFQGRGSTHNHGLYWIKDAPSLDMTTEASRREFSEAWGGHVSAHNPEPNRVFDIQNEANPLNVAGSGPPPSTFAFLSSVVNRVQRHKHNAYCQRKKKGTDVVACRFHFPHPERLVPDVTKDFNPNHWIFVGRRNDEMLNHFSPALSVGWLANTDISPCTSAYAYAVVQYVAKYCSKAEVKTQTYKELARSIVLKVKANQPAVSFAAKLRNKIIAERDWGAQEVCHILLSEPLAECSRTVVSVDCRHPDQIGSDNHMIADGQVRMGKSPLQKYLSRSAEDPWGSMTFVFFLQNIDTAHTPWRQFPHARSRVINYFPRYKKDNPAQHEDYCRVKMMVNHPHRQLDELLTVEGEVYTTFRDAYDACKTFHGNHAPDFYDTITDTPDDDEFEDAEAEEWMRNSGWEEMARELPDRPIETDDIDILGNRPIDLNYDWSPHVGRYFDELNVDAFWQIARGQHGLDLPAGDADYTEDDVASLNTRQRQVYALVCTHFDRVSDHHNPPQLLLHVDGKGGTGKSHVIKLIHHTLKQRAGPNDPMMISAPTGIAANGVGGWTLHNLLRLPVTRSFQDLSSADVSRLQNTWRNVRYLVIDGKLMVKLMALFHTKPLNDPFELTGRNVYRLFDKTIELDTIVRQQGDSQAAFREAAFRAALDQLRTSTVTVDTWRLLCTRARAMLRPQEVQQFDDALRIYFTNAEVNEYNITKLEGLESPIRTLQADNHGLNAEKVAFADAGSLHNKVHLCVGSRVMLTENTWVEAGLCNGALGTVDVWADGADWKTDQPLAILCSFDTYKGPVQVSGPGIVPIFRSTREFYKGAAACSRTQFPLTNAFAITVHKAQGLTLASAVLEILDREFQQGLVYIAVSRVKTIGGVMFEGQFNYDRFQRNETEFSKDRQNDAVARERQHNDVEPPTAKRHKADPKIFARRVLQDRIGLEQAAAINRVIDGQSIVSLFPSRVAFDMANDADR